MNSPYLNPQDRVRKCVVVNDDTGCWLWQRYVEPLGYPRLKIGGRNGVVRYAHRFSYEAFVGPIPDELELDHLCRQRSCVNPMHLEPVTHEVNVKRAYDAKNVVIKAS